MYATVATTTEYSITIEHKDFSSLMSLSKNDPQFMKLQNQGRKEGPQLCNNYLDRQHSTSYTKDCHKKEHTKCTNYVNHRDKHHSKSCTNHQDTNQSCFKNELHN